MREHFDFQGYAVAPICIASLIMMCFACNKEPPFTRSQFEPLAVECDRFSFKDDEQVQRFASMCGRDCAGKAECERMRDAFCEERLSSEPQLKSCRDACRGVWLQREGFTIDDARRVCTKPARAQVPPGLQVEGAILLGRL